MFGSASEIVVNLKGDSVTGTVLDRDRKPLPNVIVGLIPDEPLRPRFDLYRSTSTDAAGRYQLNRIPPGNYKLFSWEDIEAQSWLDRAVLRSYEDLGSPLAISEGSSRLSI